MPLQIIARTYLHKFELVQHQFEGHALQPNPGKHRRVPNLITYFKRRGFSKPVTNKAADYQAGDLVTCTVPPHLPHIMIVSDKKAADGTPLVIHNIGRGTREENSLFTYPLTGHFRWKA